MQSMSAERRLLLKAGLGALLGLFNRASFADILEAGARDARGPGGDGLLSAQVRLGENLIRILAGQGKAGADANLIVSPASLAAILSFVDLGASQPMRAALHRTLGYRHAARSRADGDLEALRTMVSALIGRSGKDGRDKDGPLALANLLAFDRSTRPRQLALFALSGAGADVLVDDLADAKIVERTNVWVRRKTRDLIPSILEEAPETLGLVAVNALYFKDKWQTPFDPARTRSEQFQLASGKPVDAQMMHSGLQKLGFRQDDRFIATELPYATEDFKLVVVTTKSMPAPASDFAAVAGWLGGQDFAVKSGEIAMPKLHLTAAEELLRPLDALGLRAARQARDALAAFSPEPLVITRVVQKLELRLDEDGTEAAAVTAAMTTRSLAPEQPVKMIVDKPFVFALRDQKTGLILFMGYVGNPVSHAR
jgi:serine protease inhibitor